MPVIVHATQENYELLSKLYLNVTFEPPPKRKEPREIIEAMLKAGHKYVLCWVSEKEKYPTLFSPYCMINKILDNGVVVGVVGNNRWKYATPFDPKTGKTIIDFVDGEVVLESENE